MSVPNVSHVLVEGSSSLSCLMQANYFAGCSGISNTEAGRILADLEYYGETVYINPQGQGYLLTVTLD